MNLHDKKKEADVKDGTLATKSDASLARAEEIVFGDTVQLVDWRQTIAWILPVLTLEWELPNMVRFEAERLTKLRAPAIECFERAALSTAGKPNAYLNEVERVRTGVSCFSEASRLSSPQSGPLHVQGDRALREALWDALEQHAQEIDQIRTAFRAEIRLDIQSLDQLPRQRLEQAEDMIATALLEEPLERSRMLRDARRLMKEVTMEPGVLLSPAVWAQFAWLCWQLSANEEEAMIALEYGTQRQSAKNTPGFALCARLYAYLYGRRERFQEAYHWAEIAVQCWPCMGAAHERVHYAACLARTDLVRRDLESYIQSGSLSGALVFADEPLGMFASELVDAVVREQMRLRQIARQEITAWDAMAKKATQLMRKLPTIVLPNDLIEGVTTSQVQNEDSNFLVAGQIGRSAAGAKEDLKCLTMAAIQTEKRKRTDALALARLKIEKAIEARDDWMKASLAAHDEAVNTARSVTSKWDGKSDAAMRGCGWSLSSGCGIMVTYVVMAMILALRGIQIGPTSVIGKVAIGLAVTPAAIAVLFHLIQSIKRMMLEAQVASEVAHTSALYEKARDEANEKFKGVIEEAQMQVAEEESHLQRVEEALKGF